MESVLGRYRNLVILVGVLFLQVLGLATQVKGTGHDLQRTRLIRVWAVGAITPFERALVWVQSGSGNIWHNYFYLRGVRAENRQLKQQIEEMRLEQVRLGEDAAQARRLQTLLAFKEQFISRTVAAQVIGSSGSDQSRSIFIDRGENAGIKRDMAVITSDGIVGKVLLVYPSVAQVLLISDQSSGVGAILEKSRLQGVLRGTSTGEVVLERVMSDEQVPVGEKLLSSGGDQIFPKGLPVGTVTKVSNGKDLFLNISVKPAANLSKLEEVLVLVEKQDRQATAEDGVRVRAADILAQRLPSVPDKPVSDANVLAPTAGAKPNSTNSAAASSSTNASAMPASVPGVAKPTPLPVVGTKPSGANSVTTGTTKSAQGSNTNAQPVKPSKTQNKPAATPAKKPPLPSSNPPAIELQTASPSAPAPANPNGPQ